jgi:hypothetical protein
MIDAMAPLVPQVAAQIVGLIARGPRSLIDSTMNQHHRNSIRAATLVENKNALMSPLDMEPSANRENPIP